MKKLTYILLAGFVALLAACDGNKIKNAGEINAKASLPESLDFAARGYKVITSSINKKLGTMSTLYGNNNALANVLADSGKVNANEEFALVTWKQQDDDRWFGAKIPGDLQSVEIVKTGGMDGTVGVDYKCFEGKKLVPLADTLHNRERIKYIFDQKPSVMP